MSKMGSKANLALVFVLAVLTVLCVTRAQQRGTQPDRPEGLDTKVAEFEMNNETLIDGLWKLARGPAPFGFGFEKVLKRKLSDPEVPDPPLRLHLKQKSIPEIFDALCEADSRYTWSMDGARVNFFPRNVMKDPAYLLNRKLRRFELRNATDVQNGLLAIVRQLPPPVEQIANAQMGGDDPYPPEPWNVTFENVTVRQVVNQLAEHGGNCAVWIFGGANDFRSFGFFNTFLCSKVPAPWIQKVIESREKSEPKPN